MVFQKEEKFPCVQDDDGFDCDDIDLIIIWIKKTIAEIISNKEFEKRIQQYFRILQKREREF